MNALAVVEALWRHTGITGIIKHAMLTLPVFSEKNGDQNAIDHMPVPWDGCMST